MTWQAYFIKYRQRLEKSEELMICPQDLPRTHFFQKCSRVLGSCKPKRVYHGESSYTPGIDASMPLGQRNNETEGRSKDDADKAQQSRSPPRFFQGNRAETNHVSPRSLRLAGKSHRIAAATPGSHHSFRSALNFAKPAVPATISHFLIRSRGKKKQIIFEYTRLHYASNAIAKLSSDAKSHYLRPGPAQWVPLSFNLTGCAPSVRCGHRQSGKEPC